MKCSTDTWADVWNLPDNDKRRIAYLKKEEFILAPARTRECIILTRNGFSVGLHRLVLKG